MKSKLLTLALTVFFLLSSSILSAMTVQKQVKLTPKETKKMETFFDNFFEQSEVKIDIKKITPVDLVTFAIWHNYRNYFKSRIQFRGEKLFVDKKYIKESVKKYFDIDLKQFPSTSLYEYNENGYLFYGADGDNGYVSKVGKVVDIGKGLLQVYGSYYSNSDVEDGRILGSFAATIKKIKFKGVNTYAIIKLDVKKN